MIDDIHHLGLSVRNVDVSAAWYEDVLGFHPRASTRHPTAAAGRCFSDTTAFGLVSA